MRAALAWTRRAADGAMHLALSLVERLPAVWQALHEGRIDLPRAGVMVRGTAHLDVVIAREVAARVLTKAPDLTTGQIASRLRRMCIDVEPDDAAKRYQEGLEARCVVGLPRPDGTADLIGENLPSDRVASVLDRINTIARQRRHKGETRTIDQLCADVFLEMLEGRHHRGSGRRPVVDIRVDLDTLMGLNDRAAEIPGWAPVIADVARQAVQRQPDGGWRVAVTDPDTGTVLWDGTTRRRPTAAQRRYVEARQTSCSHPGCGMPAHRCDYDHSRQVSKGGRTETANGGPACRHDHMLRRVGNWKLDQPQPGVYVWASPHGHTYVTYRGPP